MKKYRVKERVWINDSGTAVRAYDIEERVWLFLWSAAHSSYLDSREKAVAALKMLNESRTYYGDEK